MRRERAQGRAAYLLTDPAADCMVLPVLRQRWTGDKIAHFQSVLALIWHKRIREDCGHDWGFGNPLAYEPGDWTRAAYDVVRWVEDV